MLETFSPAARRCIVAAREETVLLGHQAIGTEHLLLGLLRDPDDPAAALLADGGLTLDGVRTAVRGSGADGARDASDPLDADALRSIGIDLDEVTDQVEAVFGADALRPTGPGGRGTRLRLGMTPHSRRVLELALRAARSPRSGVGSRRIETAHLLLGVLREGDGPTRRLLLDAGLDLAQVEREAEALG